MKLELQSLCGKWDESIHWPFEQIKSTEPLCLTVDSNIEVVLEIMKRAGKVKENVDPSSPSSVCPSNAAEGTNVSF